MSKLPKGCPNRRRKDWPRVHAALDEAGWDLKSVHLDGDGHHLEDPLPDRRPPEGRRAAGEGKAKGS